MANPDSPDRPAQPAGGKKPQGPGRPAPSRAAAGRSLLWLGLITLLLLLVWSPFLTAGDPTEVPYSTFRAQLEEGNVARVTVQGLKVEGTFVEPVDRTIPRPGDDDEETVEVDEFTTWVPAFGDDELFALLRAQGVEVVTEPESDFSWWLVLIYAVPFLFIVLLMVFLYRGMASQGQQMSQMKKSRARAYERTDEATTFDDVAGQDGPKRELEELVEFLAEPGRFEKLGGEIPRGVLLVGPPGTGKTLLARAVAGEAGVPYFHVSGSDFMEMLVGVGASRVRDLFQEAKKEAPAIIFVDELDSIGRRRGAGLGGGHDEREQTLNQLLSEMDGFEPNLGVVVIAATNRPDILDPALLRPGRFDRQVTVDLPSRKDREAILRIHARRKPLHPDVDLDEVARSTPTFSGADLKNLLNEAALLAARREREDIRSEDIDDARDKILMGLERENLVMSDEERRLLAYHEAGHAVVAAFVPETDPIHKVSIIPRGRAMGVTQQLPQRDRYIHSQEVLHDRLAILLGGRAAEELVFDTRTSGAADDLQRASRLARQMVTSWGMSEKFGRLAPGSQQEEVFLGQDIAQRREYSEATAREVDQEVRAILDRAFDRARDLLVEHREGMDALVDHLLEHDEVSGRRVMELLGAPMEDAGSEGQSEEEAESEETETAEAEE